MITSRKCRSLRRPWLSRIMDVRRLSALFLLVVLTTTFLLISEKCNTILQTRTIAGDNLEPPEWQPFPPRIFTSWSKYVRASQILQCSYFSCVSRSRIALPPMNRSERFQNSTQSCPLLFQWIHEDLVPWRRGGIAEENIKAAQENAAFRVVISGGRLYVDLYYDCVQSRMMFTIWGLLQLLDRYPGMVPDVDLMFDCMDKPTIERSKYKTPNWPPPPLFRYCSNKDHFDIPFPDWSFWGWPEVNLPPWEEEFSSIKLGSKALKWIDREPTAYWKGNPGVAAPIRMDLLNCNNSKIWGAEILQQNWMAEENGGYEQSKLSNQCRHRYKIYTEGFAWSVSFKYILACDSPVLVISPQYYDFFTRGLMPRENYWPVRSTKLCPSIKFAVDWGNRHPSEAEAIGRGGQQFMENLDMGNVYDYMFHLLSEYSKLQRFDVKVPATAQAVCKESVLCLASSTQRRFLERSIRETSTYSLPCLLPSPNHDLVADWVKKKTATIKDIGNMEKMPQNKNLPKKEEDKI